MDPLPTTFETITPGQTITNQYTYQPPGSGFFSLENQTGTFVAEVYDVPAAPGEFTANFQIVPVSGTSSSGDTRTSGIGDGGSTSTGQVLPINSTVTANRADYKVGESVNITLKIPGTGAAKPAAASVQSREQITVLDGTQVVSRTTHRIPIFKLKHLKAGQAVTLTSVWNGRPNQPGIHALKPGSYTIDVAYGEYGGSTAIALVRRGS